MSAGETKEKELETSELPDGIYILQFVNGKHVSHLKLMGYNNFQTIENSLNSRTAGSGELISDILDGVTFEGASAHISWCLLKFN